MKLEVLLSCMNQENTKIVVRSHILSDVLVINQCNEENYEEQIMSSGYRVRMISTKERGLSRSRNMALENAKGDICLICDDDECLETGYVNKIINAFQTNPQADVITFKLNNPRLKFSEKKKRIGYVGALRTFSIQIAFRRERVLQKGIRFDIKMGAGSGNGGGEENKFLFDCLKNGLKIYYVPEIIASFDIDCSKSSWFTGFTKEYFFNRGWTNRRLMGIMGGILYALAFTIIKYPKYKKDSSFYVSLIFQIKGIFSKR